jgi:hypothetical protein
MVSFCPPVLAESIIEESGAGSNQTFVYEELLLSFSNQNCDRSRLHPNQISFDKRAFGMWDSQWAVVDRAAKLLLRCVFAQAIGRVLPARRAS